MLRFLVFENGRPARSAPVETAFLLGNDRVPLRAAVSFSDGEIRCDTRARGAAALSILWPIPDGGWMMLETTRLTERARPYNLHVELARGQLMRIAQKREDWGLYDYPAGGAAVYAEVQAAKDLLVEALTAPDEVTAARLGDEAIGASVRVGERLGLFHAELLFLRRQAANLAARRLLGCRLELDRLDEPYLRALASAFDFASLPFDWRTLEPKEGRRQTGLHEQWLKACRERRIPVRGHALLDLSPARLPDWVRGNVRDYDTLRTAVAQHLKLTLKTFQGMVRSWEVINGIHAGSSLKLSFEQTMELTRMAAILVKQLAPKASAIVGITLPWGEYYAHDPRTIPPLLYAEMVVQSGITFDAFGLELRFGGEEPGLLVRDLMQVSAILDRFGTLAKPLHVTAAGVPSGGDPSRNGCWREAWSEETQADWLEALYRIALSKPFVESVTWQTLADPPSAGHQFGLLRPDFSRKAAYQRLVEFRSGLSSGGGGLNDRDD